MPRLIANISRLTPATAAIGACAALLSKDGYLREIGFVRSFRNRQPADRNGLPLPWYTYPSIAFLGPRIRETFRVFEYGSGNSTRWWARHAGQVRAVEHEPAWRDIVAADLPANAEVMLRMRENDAYAKAIEETEDRYDIVVVDGRDRNRCAEVGCERLTDGGVIVWDNSDRDRYQPGFDHLTARGFKRIDFWGMGPIVRKGWNTSVFYRPGNVLDI